MNDKLFLPKDNISLWSKDRLEYKYNKLENDIKTDVCIVGAGFTGILTAYLLKKSGVDFCIIEENDVMSGLTLSTMANITFQHDLIYNYIIKYMGEEKAYQYYKANEEGLKIIESIVVNEKINCNFENKSSFIYTNKGKYIKDIEKEMKAYEKLGIKGKITNSFFAGFIYKSALEIENQAQFNPIIFINYLLKDIKNIYTNTSAIGIEKINNVNKIVTQEGHKIQCKNIVIATNFPFTGKIGMYFARMYSEKSYVICAKSANIPEGIFTNIEKPKRSIKSAYMESERVLIINGENHKIIKNENEINRFNKLKKFAYENYNITEIYKKWTINQLHSVDNIPFIGNLTKSSKNIYIATGFGRWGISNAAAAAITIMRYIINIDNPYSQVFSPLRFDSNDVKTFIIQNVVTKKDNNKKEYIEIKNLKNDSGAIVNYNGKIVGAYRDINGIFHIVSLVCTHLKYELEWDSKNKQWYCPHHGSRYSVYGEVVEGPAKKNLEYIKLEKI